MSGIPIFFEFFLLGFVVTFGVWEVLALAACADSLRGIVRILESGSSSGRRRAEG